MWTLNFLSVLKGVPSLLLRALVGISFFAFHGLDKVRPEGTWDWGAAFADKASAVAPEWLLYVAAWTEFMAGFALLLGLLTRWAALGLCGVMAYAVFKVHWAQGFAAHVADGRSAGYEMAACYGIACLALAFLGPGSLSLDRLFFGKEALEPQ